MPSFQWGKLDKETQARMQGLMKPEDLEFFQIPDEIPDYESPTQEEFEERVKKRILWLRAEAIKYNKKRRFK